MVSYPLVFPQTHIRYHRRSKFSRFPIGGGFSCPALFAAVSGLKKRTGFHSTERAKPPRGAKQAQKKREALCRPALKSAGGYFLFSIRSAVISTPSSVFLNRRIN